MAEETFNFTEDILSSSDFIGFSCLSDGIDFDAIKLMAETGADQLQAKVEELPASQQFNQLTGIDFDTMKLIAETDGGQLLTAVEEHVIQNGVEQPASKLFNQLPVTSQVVEQPVEQTDTQLTELTQVSPQFVGQPPSPRTIDNAVLSQFVQPVSPEFVPQPVSIVLEYRPASSQDQESLTQFQLTTASMSVSNDSNTVCDLNEQKPKTRGRKPKSSTGPVRRPRRDRLPKTKVYQMEPFANVEAERKRLNAVNAKRHRDLAKQKMADLECELGKARKERENLKKMVEKLQQNEKILLQKLNQQQQQQQDIFSLEQMLFE